MPFKCSNCGNCCKELIIEVPKGRGKFFGLSLTLEETKLFPKKSVSPLWGIRKGDTLEVAFFQLNQHRCPHLTDKNTCNIYDKRPLACRSYPLSLHFDLQNVAADKLTVTAVSVDPGCLEGTRLHKTGVQIKVYDDFPAQMINDTVSKELTLFNYCTQKNQRYMMYELKSKQWVELTLESAREYLT